MRKLLTMLTIAAFLAAARTAFAADPPSWDYRGGGNWEKVNQPATRPANDETLDRAEQLIGNGQVVAGKRQVLQWIRTHGKNDPLRDRALFLLGQANYIYGNRLESFYDFDELLDLYPDSPLFNASLQRQYEIADAYLNGYKRRFLAMAMFGAQDEAIEMLYRIQQRSPGSPLAEKALLRTGDHYYKTSQFDFAADVYAMFVHSYPRSPEVPRVKLRQAFAYYAQFRGLKFDPTPILDAREQLVGVLNQHPKLAEEENLGPVIARIDETFARKIYQTGHFYLRTHEPKSAVYTWRYLINAFPKSPEAQQARRDLARLPKSALSDPAPPLASSEGPTTAPSIEFR